MHLCHAHHLTADAMRRKWLIQRTEMDVRCGRYRIQRSSYITDSSLFEEILFFEGHGPFEGIFDGPFDEGCRCWLRDQLLGKPLL